MAVKPNQGENNFSLYNTQWYIDLGWIHKWVWSCNTCNSSCWKYFKLNTKIFNMYFFNSDPQIRNGLLGLSSKIPYILVIMETWKIHLHVPKATGIDSRSPPHPSANQCKFWQIEAWNSRKYAVFSVRNLLQPFTPASLSNKANNSVLCSCKAMPNAHLWYSAWEKSH